MNQMKPVMDFSKKHVFELALAGAVVLGLFGTWWFFPAKTEEMKKEATSRLDVKKQMDSAAFASLDVAGVVFVKDGKPQADLKGLAITESLTRKKQEASDRMLEAKKRMDAAASELNLRGRVKVDGTTVVTALFDEEAIEVKDQLARDMRYLAVKDHRLADANNFLDRHYSKIFDRYAMQLTGTQNPTDGVVPMISQLDAAFKEKEAQRAAGVNALLKEQPGPGNNPFGTQQVNTKDREDFFRNGVMNVANRSDIYVDPRWSFQRRDIGAKGQLPTQFEVFEAYVDCWLQKDVVEAIREINDGAKKKRDSKQKGVAYSPIKRLVWISVGPSAMGAFASGGAAAMGPGPGGVAGGERGRERGGLLLRAPVQVAAAGAGAPPPKPTADQAFSLTGRMGDETYHVVPMSVTIVCEPSAVVPFIDALYKRNNGYTVLNRRDTTVDPYTSAGAGYLYGGSQAVQVDLLVECLLFRSWVDQIMPPGYGANAGSGPGAIPPGGIPGGIPGGPGMPPRGPGMPEEDFGDPSRG